MVLFSPCGDFLVVFFWGGGFSLLFQGFEGSGRDNNPWLFGGSPKTLPSSKEQGMEGQGFALSLKLLYTVHTEKVTYRSPSPNQSPKKLPIPIQICYSFEFV